MEMILATKGKLQREFTRAAWDRLGKEKSGWSAMPQEAQQQNAAKKIEAAKNPKPPTPPKATAQVVGAPKVETPKALPTVAELKEQLAAAEKKEAADKLAQDNLGVDANKGLKSLDGNVTNGVEHIQTLKTVEEIDAYIAGDDRVTIIAGADKQKAILNT